MQSAQLTLSGGKAVASNNRLLATVAYQLNGTRTYALEGAIFIEGAGVQWLRDGLKMVKNAADTGALAKAADKNQNVYLVPAFVGLGAPHWNANVRGALFGLTRATTNKELARAALEAVCYQTNDLLDAMRKDWGASRRNHPARRRRHDGFRLDHAIPRRHPGRTRGPAKSSGNHRDRRGVSCRVASGAAAGAGCVCQDMEAAEAV